MCIRDSADAAGQLPSESWPAPVGASARAAQQSPHPATDAFTDAMRIARAAAARQRPAVASGREAEVSALRAELLALRARKAELLDAERAAMEPHRARAPRTHGVQP